MTVFKNPLYKEFQGQILQSGIIILVVFLLMFPKHIFGVKPCQLCGVCGRPAAGPHLDVGP